MKLAKLIGFLLDHLEYEVKLTRDKDCLPIWAERVESSEKMEARLGALF